MKGKIDECIAYCKKDGIFTEQGVFKTERQRTDVLKLLSENNSY